MEASRKGESCANYFLGAESCAIYPKKDNNTSWNIKLHNECCKRQGMHIIGGLIYGYKSF